MNFFSKFLIVIIKIYKGGVSPLLGSRCRFYPTCSDYARECLTTLPLKKALLKSAYRLLRCGPWAKSGFDPVVPVSSKEQL